MSEDFDSEELDYEEGEEEEQIVGVEGEKELEFDYSIRPNLEQRYLKPKMCFVFSVIF